MSPAGPGPGIRSAVPGTGRGPGPREPNSFGPWRCSACWRGHGLRGPQRIRPAGGGPARPVPATLLVAWPPARRLALAAGRHRDVTCSPHPVRLPATTSMLHRCRDSGMDAPLMSSASSDGTERADNGRNMGITRPASRLPASAEIQPALTTRTLTLEEHARVPSRRCRGRLAWPPRHRPGCPGNGAGSRLVMRRRPGAWRCPDYPGSTYCPRYTTVKCRD